MPDGSVHLAQAEHNEEIAVQMKNIYPGWSITVTFYSALHYYEYWLFNNGSVQHTIVLPSEETSPHAKRKKEMRNELKNKIQDKNQVRNACVIYNNLRNYSEQARYLSEGNTGNKHIQKISRNLFSKEEAEQQLKKLEEFKIILGID